MARIGFSATSNASSVTREVGDAHRARRAACSRRTASAAPPAAAPRARPDAASASFACSASARGCTSVSSAASCGWMPSSTASAFASGSSSWSVASISASSLIVSTAGALQAQRLRAVAAVARRRACTCSVRVSVSGLYWSAITRSTCAGLGIDLDEAALEQPRRERCHRPLTSAGSSRGRRRRSGAAPSACRAT